mgnify:CR=1 FL=1
MLGVHGMPWDVLQKGIQKMSILIKNGRVIDPDTRKDGRYDILIEEDKIVKVDQEIKEEAEEVIDAEGCYVMPGLIDLHVHLRDPGQTYKETVETGAAAAAHGGFTTVLAMPNTKPVTDDRLNIRYVHNKAKAMAPIHVLQAGAITKGQKGKELADIESMVAEGAPAISEDGKSVMDSLLCKEAMKIAAECGVPVMAHCEDIDLVDGGVANDDESIRKQGLRGISNAVEDIIAVRDVMLAGETGAHLHLCHCSTYGSVEIVKQAKKQDIHVTAEVCPHHFTLTSKDVDASDANYKMNPPLRTQKDVDALIAGLKDGSFKVISTDHAPHAVPEKTGSIRNAAFGIVGIETSFALSYTALVETGILTISQLIEKMSWNPAQILGIDRGTIQEGHPADVVIADIDHEYTIDKSEFASKGRNTPFDGWKVKGKILYTICDGKVVYQNA